MLLLLLVGTGTPAPQAPTDGGTVELVDESVGALSLTDSGAGSVSLEDSLE